MARSKEINVLPLAIVAFFLLCIFALGEDRVGCLWSLVAMFFFVFLALIFAFGRQAKTRREIKYAALIFGLMSIPGLLVSTFLSTEGFHLVWRPETLYVGGSGILLIIGLFVFLKSRRVEILISLGGILHT